MDKFYHEFDIKGSFPGSFRDNVLRKGYTDLGVRLYGKLIFHGTEEEMEAFYKDVLTFDERHYKVIGITSRPELGYDTKGKLILTKKQKQDEQSSD